MKKEYSHGPIIKHCYKPPESFLEKYLNIEVQIHIEDTHNSSPRNESNYLMG